MESNRTASGLSPVTPVAEAPVHPVRPAARLGEEKRRRGFAAMDPAQQQRISVEGGKAAHSSGRAHQWTSAEAREAGRKGGLISRRKSKEEML